MDTNFQDQHSKLSNYIKWGIGILGAVIISPIVFLAVKGIVGLAIAVFTGAVVINVAPAAGNMLANWKLKLIKDEANRNPIETMENLFIEKQKELNQADTNITEFDTEVRNYDDQLSDFKKQYPEEANTYQEISNKMHQAYENMVSQQSEARQALVDFQQKITRAKAIYKMALAADHVTTLSKSAEQQAFSEIREKVAFDTVRSSLNRSFANLNMAVQKRSDVKGSLPAPSNETTIEVIPKLSEKVRSNR